MALLGGVWESGGGVGGKGAVGGVHGGRVGNDVAVGGGGGIPDGFPERSMGRHCIVHRATERRYCLVPIHVDDGEVCESDPAGKEEFRSRRG